MSKITIEIDCDCPINDTSAAGLADLFYGIDDGQVDGSVKVVQTTPVEPVETYQTETTLEQIEPIEVRLWALQLEWGTRVTPIILRDLRETHRQLVPGMTYQEVSRVIAELQDVWAMAAEYGWIAFAAEVAYDEEALRGVLYTLDDCEG